MVDLLQVATERLKGKLCEKGDLLVEWKEVLGALAGCQACQGY